MPSQRSPLILMGLECWACEETWIKIGEHLHLAWHYLYRYDHSSRHNLGNIRSDCHSLCKSVYKGWHGIRDATVRKQAIRVFISRIKYKAVIEDNLLRLLLQLCESGNLQLHCSNRNGNRSFYRVVCILLQRNPNATVKNAINNRCYDKIMVTDKSVFETNKLKYIKIHDLSIKYHLTVNIYKRKYGLCDFLLLDVLCVMTVGC